MYNHYEYDRYDGEVKNNDFNAKRIYYYIKCDVNIGKWKNGTKKEKEYFI